MTPFRWLPRLIFKARLKLRGEMDPEIMYGCGGDRQFFVKYDIHPADFLRAVWASGGDQAKVLAFVDHLSERFTHQGLGPGGAPW